MPTSERSDAGSHSVMLLRRAAATRSRQRTTWVRCQMHGLERGPGRVALGRHPQVPTAKTVFGSYFSPAGELGDQGVVAVQAAQGYGGAVFFGAVVQEQEAAAD